MNTLRHLGKTLREGDPRPSLLGLALAALVRGVWFIAFLPPDSVGPAYGVLNLWSAQVWGVMLIAAAAITVAAFAMEAHAAGDRAEGLHATVRDNADGATPLYRRARSRCARARHLFLWAALFHAWFWMLLGGALLTGDYRFAGGAVYLVFALTAAWCFGRVQLTRCRS